MRKWIVLGLGIGFLAILGFGASQWPAIRAEWRYRALVKVLSDRGLDDAPAEELKAIIEEGDAALPLLARLLRHGRFAVWRRAALAYDAFQPDPRPLTGYLGRDPLALTRYLLAPQSQRENVWRDL
jgi:hypothetical protein